MTSIINATLIDLEAGLTVSRHLDASTPDVIYKLRSEGFNIQYDADTEEYYLLQDRISRGRLGELQEAARQGRLAEQLCEDVSGPAIKKHPSSVWQESYMARQRGDISIATGSLYYD